MSTLLTKLTADFNTQLSTAISVGGTTATLLSQTDDDGVTLPDGVYVFTLDGSTSNKEYIRCTKTGTSLTSIQSLSRQGALTSGCVRAHRVGTSVIITDWAQLKYLTDLLTGATDLDSSDPLKYDGTATLTSGSNQLATVIYAEGLANQGAANASTSVKGIAKLSTAAVDSNEPIVVGDNDTRMPTQSENDALVGTSGTPSSSNKYVTNDDTSSSAVADKVVRANGTSLPGLDGSALLNIPEIYGPGSDGAVTINSGSFTSGPITNNTLTRDAYFTDLTIDSTRVLDTANFKIFCTGTLTNNGTIRCNGGNASGTTAGTAVASGTLFGGSNGGAGVSSSGGGSATGGGGGGGGGTIVVYAKNIVNNSSITANGGNGANAAGSGGSVGNSNGNVGTNLTLASRGGAGGASGTATIGISASSGGTVATSTVTDNAFKLFTNYASFFDFVNISPIKAGGGGGGGGFNVGANSAATGGGGGGGGVVLLVYQNGTFSTETATGGTGGTSTATSGSTTSGSSGSSGSVIKIQLT